MNDDVLKFREFIRTVGRGERRAKALSFDDAREAMAMVLEGRAGEDQRGAFLLACRIRGEDPVEMAGFVAAMQERCAHFALPSAQNAVTVGHPYDGREDTYIMGAGAAIVAAAAGANVVLHGAGRVPAKHAGGVGDVLRNLGLPYHMGLAEAPGFLATHGFAHLDMRVFMPAWNGQLDVRERLGLRLPFASAEKLLDPARTGNVIAGIAHGPYLAKMTGAMTRLGLRGMIVQGLEGSADLSPEHPARVAVAAAQDGVPAEEISVDPRALGLSPALDIRSVGADPLVCAALTRDALENKSDERSRGAAEALAFNAAVLIWRAELAPDMAGGLDLARKTIQSGAAGKKLNAAAQAVAVK
jgi:anthranilate phosphoribosyltransferase